MNGGRASQKCVERFTWRVSLVFGSLLAIAGCEDAPAPPPCAPAPVPVSWATLMKRVPVRRAPAPAARSSKCDYDPTPMLSISPTRAALDGLEVDEANIEATLKERQALYVALGGQPRREIVVQVYKGVSEKRVERFLARGQNAGFVEVTRMSDGSLVDR